MIIDVFENCNLYFPLNKRFKQAFDYILNTDFSLLSCGRYDVLGENGSEIYANVDEYETKILSKPEYHKKYIDIQFLVQGEEFVGYCPKSELVVDEDYNEEKDLGFGLAVVDYIRLNENKFMIFFPDDAHQPCMALKEPKLVKKVVVKVRIDD